MAINDHSRYAPSAFAITVNCPGSVRLQEQVPPQADTEEIAEGKAAHHVAARGLASGVIPSVGTTFELDGRAWTVDEDMHDGAVEWVDAMGPGCVVEEVVHIPRVHAECWGTPDGWRFFPDETPRRLRVGDYKYGHRYVDPFENLQVGVGYVTGVAHRLGLSAGDDETIVEVVVVQPRAFHRDGPVQIWRTTLFKLNGLLTKVRDAVALAASANPPTQTGGHCRDCKARHVCDTLRRSAAHIVDFSGTVEATVLDTHAAAIELRILYEARERLEARETGLYAQLDAAARNGINVPYWSLEPGQSRLEWAPDATVDELRGLATMLGVDLNKPQNPKNLLLTPTQAIKNKKVDPAVIDAYAVRKPAGVTLKPDTGKAARKVFGK